MLLVDAFARLRELGADILGVNCMNGPNEMVQLLQQVPVSGQLLAAYPNAGHPKYTDVRFIYHTAPDYFAKAARQMVVEGARLIGGCCGTNPGHIAAMSAAIADLRPVRSGPDGGKLARTNCQEKSIRELDAVENAGFGEIVYESEPWN
jgi:hypothetical protein